MKQFEEGSIQLLWAEELDPGPGPRSLPLGVGLYGDRPVLLSIDKNPLKDEPKWRKLYSFIYSNNTQAEADKIWVFTLKEFDLSPKKYSVWAISSQEFEKASLRQDQYRSHIGFDKDYFYSRSEWPRTGDRHPHCINGRVYSSFHMPEYFPILSQEKLGEIRFVDLIFSKSHNFSSELPLDTRSEELKEYQRNWKLGDEVILDW